MRGGGKTTTPSAGCARFAIPTCESKGRRRLSISANVSAYLTSAGLDEKTSFASTFVRLLDSALAPRLVRGEQLQHHHRLILVEIRQEVTRRCAALGSNSGAATITSTRRARIFRRTDASAIIAALDGARVHVRKSGVLGGARTVLDPRFPARREGPWKTHPGVRVPDPGREPAHA